MEHKCVFFLDVFKKRKSALADHSEALGFDLSSVRDTTARRLVSRAPRLQAGPGRYLPGRRSSEAGAGRDSPCAVQMSPIKSRRQRDPSGRQPSVPQPSPLPELEGNPVADSKSDKNLRQRKDSVPGHVLEGGQRVLQNAKRRRFFRNRKPQNHVFPGSQDAKLERSSEALWGMFPPKAS